MSKYLDDRGRFRTKSLFFEEIGKNIREAGYEPVFTLKSREHKGLPSLKNIYMMYKDPTEYEFAEEVFGSWQHWQHLCTLTWFKPHITEWRDEMEIRMRSQAIKAIMDTAVNEGSKGTNAAKYIAEKGWEKRAGRPTKEQVKREAKQQAGITKEVEEDAKRLDLH